MLWAHNRSLPVILTILTEPLAVYFQFLCLQGNYPTDDVHYQRNYHNGCELPSSPRPAYYALGLVAIKDNVVMDVEGVVLHSIVFKLNLT